MIDYAHENNKSYIHDTVCFWPYWLVIYCAQCICPSTDTVLAIDSSCSLAKGRYVWDLLFCNIFRILFSMEPGKRQEIDFP